MKYLATQWNLVKTNWFVCRRALVFKKAIMFVSAEEDVLTDCLSLRSHLTERKWSPSRQPCRSSWMRQMSEPRSSRPRWDGAELTVSIRSLLNGPVTCHTDRSVFCAHYPAGLLFSIFTSLHHLIETLRKGLIRLCVFFLTPALKLKRSGSHYSLSPCTDLSIHLE